MGGILPGVLGQARGRSAGDVVAVLGQCAQFDEVAGARQLSAAADEAIVVVALDEVEPGELLDTLGERSCKDVAPPRPSGRIESASADGVSGLAVTTRWPPSARSRWKRSCACIPLMPRRKGGPLARCATGRDTDSSFSLVREPGGLAHQGDGRGLPKSTGGRRTRREDRRCSAGSTKSRPANEGSMMFRGGRRRSRARCCGGTTQSAGETVVGGRTAARNADRRRYAVATNRIAAAARRATRLPQMLATQPDTNDAIATLPS